MILALYAALLVGMANRQTPNASLPPWDITAANTESLAVAPDPHSYASYYLPPGAVAVTADIVPTVAWTGTLHAYYQSALGRPLRPLPDTNIINLANNVPGAIASGASGLYTINVPAGGGLVYLIASTWSGGGDASIVLYAGPGTRAGKAVTMLAAPSGSTNGLVAAGSHIFSHYWGDNFSGTTLYLQFFDATSLPSTGTAAIAQVVVPFGIGTAPSETPRAFGEDWIQVFTGLYYAWSTTSGTLTLASSGAGLGFEVYGG